ncbi:MAG: cation:dicarboxylase symporter family transporter, partial [Bacteroidota bacterium]
MWKKLPLHVKIIIGLIAGIIYSLLSSYMGWNKFTIDWIDPFGVIFIRLLKFIAVPLVMFSIIAGIAGLTDLSKLPRMGGKTLVAYLITTVFAVGIGLLLANTLKPGNYIAEEQRIKNRIQYEVWVDQTPGVEILDGKNFAADPKYADLVANTELGDIPDDVRAKMEAAKDQKGGGPLQFIVDMVPDNIFAALTTNQMLQVIFFGIFFGIVLIQLPKEH